MAIEVVQAGVLATIQDAGRVGYRGRGINPGGAMDQFALRAVNALVGNELEEAVMEMHFPAPRMVFREGAVVCLGGADFQGRLNERPVERWRPYCVTRGDELSFGGRVSGYRAYLSVRGGFDVPAWLGSRSTHLLAGLGGHKGRALGKGDRVALRALDALSETRTLPWKMSPELVDQAYGPRAVRVLPGPEWNWLDATARSAMWRESFSIARDSNRVGYRLEGPVLERTRADELLSGGLTFGTVQLPPGGQPIVLMADHPVTGGYPRIAHVIAVDLPLLAQCGPGDGVRFTPATQAEAERLYLTLDSELRQFGEACRTRMR